MSARREIRAALARIRGAQQAARRSPRRGAPRRANCPGRAARFALYASRIIRGALTGVHRVIREAAAELARINRAGLGPDTLAGLSRRARARLVTAALARRHHRQDRCC